MGNFSWVVWPAASVGLYGRLRAGASVLLAKLHTDGRSQRACTHPFTDLDLYATARSCVTQLPALSRSPRPS